MLMPPKNFNFYIVCRYSLRGIALNLIFGLHLYYAVWSVLSDSVLNLLTFNPSASQKMLGSAALYQRTARLRLLAHWIETLKINPCCIWIYLKLALTLMLITDVLSLYTFHFCCWHPWWQKRWNITNWERTLVQISESPNCRSAIENMFREVLKWTPHVLLGNTTSFWNLDCIS
jgi:hypothetical protein